jgi:hypothetical protein
MSESSSSQLPFETPEPRSRLARAWLRSAGSRLVFWAPVWVPLAVLAQVALLGLGPALAESRRLDGAARDLSERLERERTAAAELQRLLRAQSDPIYLERERRLLRAPDGPLPVK